MNKRLILLVARNLTMKFKNNYLLLLLLGTFYSNVSAAQQEHSMSKEDIFKKSYEGLFTPNTVLAMPITPPTERKQKGSILKSLASSVAASATVAASSAKVAHELAPKTFKKAAATATGVGTFCCALAAQYPFSEEPVITDASKSRKILEQHFNEIRKIDEKIADIEGTNKYFSNLLHDEHECNLNCKDECPTNAPLTKMNLTLDAQNIAKLSLLTTERTESLKKLRDFYKHHKKLNYTFQETNASDSEKTNASDSEEEGAPSSNDNAIRIKTKEVLQNHIRHTNKVYNTVYYKIDEHNQRQVPVTVEALTIFQQQAQAQQVQNGSNSYLKTAVSIVPTALSLAVQYLSK